MSKAFTKDDDDAGFEAPKSSLTGIPAGPFRLTFKGAHLAAISSDDRVRAAATHATPLDRVVAPERAALGVTVVVRDEKNAERRYRLVSPEERALIGEGCSVEGPIGRALVGVQVGDVCEVTLPRGAEELEVIGLEGESDLHG